MIWSVSTGAINHAGLVGLADGLNNGEPASIVWFGSSSRALDVARTAPLSSSTPQTTAPGSGVGSESATILDGVNSPGQVVDLLDLDMHAVIRGGSLYLVPGSSFNAAYLGWAPGQAPPLDSTRYHTYRFPAALYPIAIAGTNVDGVGLEDLVIATQNGQVGWIPGETLIAELQTSVSSSASGELLPIEALVLGMEWFGPVTTGVLAGIGPAEPDGFSSGSVTGTWGMTWGPGGVGGPIECVDQCGRMWAVDPTTGVATYRQLVMTSDLLLTKLLPQTKPFRDLVWLGSNLQIPTAAVLNVFDPRLLGVVQTAPLQGGNLIVGPAKMHTWFDAAVFPNSAFPVDAESGDSHFGYMRTIQSQVYAGVSIGQAIHHFLPFSFGGDLLGDGGDQGAPKEAYYWTGCSPLLGVQGVVRGLRHDVSPGPFTVWGTSTNLAPLYDPGPPPESQVPSGSRQIPLRTATTNLALHDSQSLRVGTWPEGDRVILSMFGGGLQVLNPGTIATPTTPATAMPNPQSQLGGDKGLGGTALCVEPVGVMASNLPVPTIFFGTFNTHAGGPGVTGGATVSDMVSSLHIYGMSGTSLSTGQETIFDGGGTRPMLFGLCGIATGNLVDDSDGIEPELVLTTLNGDLLVYNLLPSSTAGGVAIGARPLHWSIHDGSLGANNGILVDDQSTERAVFVAGSMGMRKFVVGGL